MKLVNVYKRVVNQLLVDGNIAISDSGKVFSSFISEYELAIYKRGRDIKPLEFNISNFGLEYGNFGSIFHVHCPIEVEDNVVVLDARALYSRKMISQYTKRKLVGALSLISKNMRVGRIRIRRGVYDIWLDMVQS